MIWFCNVDTFPSETRNLESLSMGAGQTWCRGRLIGQGSDQYGVSHFKNVAVFLEMKGASKVVTLLWESSIWYTNFLLIHRLSHILSLHSGWTDAGVRKIRSLYSQFLSFYCLQRSWWQSKESMREARDCGKTRGERERRREWFLSVASLHSSTVLTFSLSLRRSSRPSLYMFGGFFRTLLVPFWFEWGKTRWQTLDGWTFLL